MSDPRLVPWLPLSLRFLVPEIDAAAGPHGLVTCWWWHCFEGHVHVGGRFVPYETYVTTCTEEIANSFPPPFPEVPHAWKEPGCPVRGRERVQCYNPCPFDCLPPAPDLFDWRSLVPLVWDYPEILVSSTATLALSDDDDAWWY